MRERLEYEKKPAVGDESAGGVTVGVEGGGGEAKVIEGSAGESGSGVVKASFKPKGTSITLYGCGRRDGSDVNNSMGLEEAYKMILGV